MIKGSYVLISSLMGAAVYTLIITIFRDRVLEMMYEYLPVPDSSAYSVDTSIFTWALYAVPIVMVFTGFVYFLMRATPRESDTLPVGYYR